jgi:hypothetical protein
VAQQHSAAAVAAPRRSLDEKPEDDGDRASTTSSNKSSTSEDLENGGAATTPAAAHKKATPWRKYNSINPLRWQEAPPPPKERLVSKEAEASYWSQAIFSWVGDLMRVCTLFFTPLCFTVSLFHCSRLIEASASIEDRALT